MDTPSTPSLAGPARRTRRGAAATPAGSTTNLGRPGSAINAADSPYARQAPATVASSRPNLRRDASSSTLARLEGGQDAQTPAPVANKKDRRRSLMGAVGSSDTPSLLGRVVRKSLGWLVGRPIPNLDDDAESESRGDEETGQAHDTRDRGTDNKSARPASLAFPPPPAKRTYAACPSVASSSLAFTQYQADDTEDIVSPKRIRSSHSTLNLPTAASVPSSLARASAGPSYAASRHRSPVRNTSPSRPNGFGSGLSRSKTSIFAGRPPPLALSANLPTSASMRSASPGADSQTALAAPASASSSTFGLQSQSPFRIGRSPELPVDALNISSGLARSPSVPLERLAIQQQKARLGDRLYPYQRSPSAVSQTGRPGNIPFSFSMANGMSGSKRSHAAMSTSPPKISPARSNFSFSRYNIPSPSSTDFAGSDGYHRAKRQKTSVVWDPSKGFIAGDEHGNPIKDEPTQSGPPKNEAERILERLESIRRPQLDTLRNKSPKRINVPLPAISTSSNDSIFATQITASRSVPALTSHAISPYARRQLAVEEQTTSQRDKLRSEGGLGERMRLAVVERENRRKRMEADEEEIDRLMTSTEAQEVAAKRGDDRHDQEGEDQDGEAEEHLADLPQPPRRRTRQRTRELSVMSEASDMQEDSQAFSPRRSTRHKGKGRAQESETEYAQPSSKRRPGQARAPKSAKAPEPVEPKKKAKKVPKSGKQTNIRDGDSATESEEHESAEEGVKTRSGRRLRSPGPASPPPAAAARKTKEKRPTSPVPDKAANRRQAAASIDQVMAPDTGESKNTQSRSQSSRSKDVEETTSRPASRRKLMSFAASDNEEDEDDEAPPTEEPAPVDNEGQSSRPERLEMAKLKLPNSIFTNRFSFGKTPQSPVLAARSRSASVFEKQELPPAVTSVEDSGASEGIATGESSQATTKPMFAFKPPTLEPSASASLDTPLPAPTTSSFSFKPASQATGTETNAIAKPASPFSFALPVNPVPPSVEGTTAPATSDSSKSDGPPAIASPAPAFNFGSKPSEVQSVNGASQAPSLQADKAKSTPFSFGMPKTATEPPAVNASANASNPFAAFPSATSTAPSDVSNKAPTFSFNTGSQNSASTDKPVSTPSFTFSKPASAANEVAQPASKPSFSGFSFKPATGTGVSDTPAKVPAPTDGSVTNGTLASPDAMQQSPPTIKPAASTAGPFSPVIAPAAKGFSFGTSTATTPTPVETSKPAFSFGAAQTAPSVQSSSTAAPTFSFGVSSPSTTSTPAFSFGSNAASGQPPSSSAGASTAFGANGAGAASANPFGAAATPAFGASSQTSAPKPAFTFGSATPSPSSNTAFNFGNNATAAPSAPSFTFGSGASQPSSQSQPAFSFGASSNTAASTPAFSFGGAAPSPGGFTFSAAPTPSVGGSMTPGGTGIPGASLFNAGIVGDEPTSPNKGRRPIKGLRGARKP